MNKFDRLYKLLMESVEGEINFVTTTQYGPENTFIVKKSDVFAHEITDDDVKKLGELSSREGNYDDTDKVPGNFICTAKGITNDDGKFWIVTPEKFAKNYEKTPTDDETLTEEYGGIKLTFKHFNSNGDAKFQCFKLPMNAPKNMQINNNKFEPGDYVFIENGNLDQWARSASFMQKQYKLEEKISIDDEKIIKQYNDLIKPKEQENTKNI